MSDSTSNKRSNMRLRIGSASMILILLVLFLAGCATATAVPTEAPPVTGDNTGQTGGDQVDPSYFPEEPVAVIPQPNAGDPTITATYNTVIRGGPGNNYQVYGAFLGSAKATAVGKSEDGKWWAVSVPVAPNGMGWVSVDWALTENVQNLPVVPAPPVPPTVDIIPPGPDDPQATSLTEVFVRTGPSDQYPAYGIAKSGATARVLGKSTDGLWWVVRLNPDVVGAGNGWVLAAYTQAKNVDSVPQVQADPLKPVDIPPPAGGVPTATALDYINLRSGPGFNYPVLGVANPGATGEVSGKSQDGAWWQVKIPESSEIQGGFVWVSADWVITANTGSVPVVEAPPAP